MAPGALSPLRRAVGAITPDRRPALALVVVPLLFFVLPALAGWALISDDNLLQNYPLRVLTGQIIHSGHLPLWDPFLWSGTPLLAGFNAGAAFPATWLFALLPDKAAWVVGQVGVYAVAALGLYAFLRLHALARAPAALGAASFAFSGFSASQVVHIDLVQGAALLPWALVALRRLATGPGVGWRWVGLLGLVIGLLALTGAPEAVLDGGAVIVVYAASLVVRFPGRWRPIVGGFLVGAAGGALLGAVQLLPGLVFAGHSQRSASSFAFFATGSLPPQLTVLGLVPYLLGGYGRWGIPIYLGPFNLPEVTSYVGLLPLVAASSLLVSRRWRRHRSAGDWWVWYVVVAVGLLLAVGSHTPVGHLLFHLPVYGSQRLQNRNLVSADLGLSVLLAFWLERVRTDTRAGSRRWPELLVALCPTVAVLAVVVTSWGWRSALLRSLGANLAALGVGADLHRYLIITAVIAAAVGMAAFAYHRIPAGRRMRVLGAVTVVDLAYFTLNGVLLAPAAPAVVDATMPAAVTLRAMAGPTRLAVYDPTLGLYDEYLALGVPDLNLLHHAGSVQGYGSLVSGDYQQATGSHDQATIYPPFLRGSTFDQLDLGVLVTPASSFAVPVNPSAPTPPPAPPSITTTGPPLPKAVPPGPLAPGSTRSFYLGSSLQLRSLTGTVTPGGGGSAAGLAVRVGVMAPSGRVVWPAARTSVSAYGHFDARFVHPAAAVAAVVENRSSVPVTLTGLGAATTSPGRDAALALDGTLEAYLKPPHWAWAGTVGGFATFRNTRARGRFWLTAAGGHGAVGGAGPVGAAVRVDSEPLDGAQRFTVTAGQPVTLVRSEAWAPGWSAEVSPGTNTGTVKASGRAAVVRVGSVPLQGVRLGAGTHTVTFTYEPAGVKIGLALSLSALAVGILGLMAWWGRAHRRRRRSPSRWPPGLRAG